MRGGHGNDVLLGGPDRDVVFGAVGRDLLIGGDGPDTVQGAVGEDILIGGWTAHDADDDALYALAAEWQSPRTIAERINNLVNGGGLNGTYTLDGSVSDDAFADLLEGSWGADWFIVFETDEFADGEPTPSDHVTQR
jgi:Ca2+-binding RTX toxin-like protein